MLWRSPTLYIGVRARLARSSLGALVYVGESVDFSRRAYEHVLRLLRPHACTQQPFYAVVRGRPLDLHSMKCNVSQWLFIPFAAASVCA